MSDGTESGQWLTEFARTGSESAFSALVERHLPWVYGVALRRCSRDHGLAQDVCQTVFIDLARKAGTVCHAHSTAGWLHQHCCFVSAKAVRSERRRFQRETKAMSEIQKDPAPNWEEVGPVLDDVLLELNARDRDALLLRFFDGLTFPEIGRRIGTGDSGARMRVDRALEALRMGLTRRGITSTGAALASVLTATATATPPAGLAGGIAAAALSASAASGSVLGIFSFMTSSATKTTAAALLVAVTAGGFLLEHQRSTRLQEQNARLQEQNAALLLNVGKLAGNPPSPAPDSSASDTSPGKVELLRLRGEVAQLHRQLAERSGSSRPNSGSPMEGVQESSLKVGGKAVPLTEWRDEGTATPEAAAMSFAWAVLRNDTETLRNLREPMSDELTRWLKDNVPGYQGEDQLLEPIFGSLINGTLSLRIAGARASPDTQDRLQLQLEFLKEGSRKETLEMQLRKSNDAWRIMPVDVEVLQSEIARQQRQGQRQSQPPGGEQGARDLVGGGK